MLKDKSNDALNLQKQLDKVEEMLKENVTVKEDKCVGTDDFVTLKTLHKPEKKAKRTNSIEDKNKNQNSPFSQNSMLNIQMSEMYESALVVDTKQSCKGGQPERDMSTQCPAPDSPAPTTEREKVVNLTEVDRVPQLLSTPSFPHIPTPLNTREPSLIEISEEKLRTLKQRARKLEDSLHDAIHSMEKLNKVTPREENVLAGKSLESILARPSRSHQPPHHHDQWRKVPLQVNGVLATPMAPDVARPPRLTVVKRPGFHSERRCKSEVPSGFDLEMELSSHLEHKGHLEGKSLHTCLHTDGSLSHRTQGSSEQPSPIGSSMRMTLPDRLHGTTPAAALGGNTPRTALGDYSQTSGDENTSDINDDSRPRRHKPRKAAKDNGVVSGVNQVAKWASRTSRKQTKAASGGQFSRFRHTGRGMVAKCLRCNKLFSSIDNHKLACCYHVKEKERVEHYDQDGRLIRVIYAWRCCQQPQESDGCCYGQHV